MPTRPFTCLLISDATAPGMQPVESLLRTRFPNRTLCRDRLSAASTADFSADLIVVAQSWSDQYTPADVAALLSAAPLARILCVYGRWCDSDGRTRDIWPLAVRVPAEEFETRLRRELEVLERTLPPLPLTASRTEIFAARLPPAATLRGGRSKSSADSNRGT